MFEPNTTTDWPDGVIVRYLTAGGATVDLTGGGNSTCHRCTGCGAGSADYGEAERTARRYAQAHAEKCRALPKPKKG